MTWQVTTESHYMRDKFPAGCDPVIGTPWVPLVIGEHDTREQAERHVARIISARNGVLPTNRTYRLVAPDGTTFRAAS